MNKTDNKRRMEKNEKYIPMNMKRKKVDNVYNDENLLLYVFNYREFINNYFIDFVQKLQNFNISYTISSKVKSLNSIQYKIENYNRNHENGKIPIKKCLNDLLGIRIIF